MAPFTIHWFLLFVAALLALAALCYAAWLHSRLRTSELRYNRLLKMIRAEVQVMNSGSIGVGQKLKGLEGKLDRTIEKQTELENRDPDALAYNQAARLMEMGAGVDDLVSQCGIARPEAELMALLHREIRANPALEGDS